MKKLWFVTGSILLLSACQNTDAPSGEKSVEEIMNENQLGTSAMVRNPVSADQPEDTVNVARITFEEEVFDFGEVDEGEVIEHVFLFTNTGKIPLLVNHARSTCGCTVPRWPVDPIPPGETGEISVRFNTANKANLQNKPVYITGNTYPATTTVYLKGVVRSKKEASK